MPVLPNDVRAIGEADAKARVREPRMFANPIVVGTTVIRMKDCRIRNENEIAAHPVLSKKQGSYGGQGKTAGRNAGGFAIWRRSARRVIRKL